MDEPVQLPPETNASEPSQPIQPEEGDADAASAVLVYPIDLTGKDKVADAPSVEPNLKVPPPPSVTPSLESNVTGETAFSTYESSATGQPIGSTSIPDLDRFIKSRIRIWKASAAADSAGGQLTVLRPDKSVADTVTYSIIGPGAISAGDDVLMLFTQELGTVVLGSLGSLGAGGLTKGVITAIAGLSTAAYDFRIEGGSQYIHYWNGDIDGTVTVDLETGDTVTAYAASCSPFPVLGDSVYVMAKGAGWVVISIAGPDGWPNISMWESSLSSPTYTTINSTSVDYNMCSEPTSGSVDAYPIENGAASNRKLHFPAGFYEYTMEVDVQVRTLSANNYFLWLTPVLRCASFDHTEVLMAPDSYAMWGFSRTVVNATADSRWTAYLHGAFRVFDGVTAMEGGHRLIPGVGGRLSINGPAYDITMRHALIKKADWPMMIDLASGEPGLPRSPP